jgi:FixJ family two-component response regulator
LIVVVDDDVSVRRSLLRLLRSAGFQVDAYESGESFLARTDAEPAACLILDVHLGGISGPDLKQELNRQGLAVPTIFISAHDEEATRESRALFPDVPWLRKPFSGGALIELIQQAVRG